MIEDNGNFEVIKEIARPFWVNSKSSKPPKLVVLTGGVGTGKTTIRREKYADHINFDFGEISAAVKDFVGQDNPQLEKLAILTCALILEIAVSSKKDIVIEIIGDNEALIMPVIEGMKNVGYEISIVHVYADPVVAYQRHAEAVANDKDYISSYFTQMDTLFFFFQNLGLGDMPQSSDDSLE